MTSIVIPAEGAATLVATLIEGNLAIAIGRGVESWGVTPPPPDIEATSLVDPIGISKALYQHFVTPNESGEIQASDGSRWSLSNEPTRFLYVSILLDYNDASGEVVREYALYRNPTFESSVLPGQSYVPINEVADLGQLIGIKNISPITRVVARQTISEIIDF